jgi:hypothetical protein
MALTLAGKEALLCSLDVVRDDAAFQPRIVDCSAWEYRLPCYYIPPVHKSTGGENLVR